jgi:hypothetical protein
VRTHGLDIAEFRNDVGFEQIAKDLMISYPDKQK